MGPHRPLRPLSSLCASCARRPISSRPFIPIQRRQYVSDESNLPRVATSSFWSSMIPRFLRSRSSDTPSQPPPKRQWNPATIFIFLAILVGSNAIQIIALRNEMLNFSRKTDAKLGLLREVVQRIKDGEEVDVKRLLGTGDEKSEREWEEVMKELEETDMLAEGRRKREQKRLEKARKREEAEEERKRGRDNVGAGQDSVARDDGKPKFLM